MVYSLDMCNLILIVNLGYGRDESDSKIGKTKSIAYPIGKALDCPISCQKALGVIVDDDIVLRFR